MEQTSTGVIIIGGTGFGAGELLRLFTLHPEVQVVSVVSSSAAGKSLSDQHPHLRGFYQGMQFSPAFDPEALTRFKNRVLISALPHGVSATTLAGLIPQCQRHGIKIIDLSGDFRLKDGELHKEYYPKSSLEPQVRGEFTYGIPELFRNQIQTAKAITNPGCLATAAVLALAPLGKLNVSREVVINMSTGSSGAGKELKETTHHPVRHANYFGYKPFCHQHEPEIIQGVEESSGTKFSLSCVAHSLPISRGIFISLYATAKEAISTEELIKHFEIFYKGSPFVRILASGSPEIENIVGSNFCDISVSAKDSKILVMTAIDNLVKGMAGQAIQNMNLMLGFPETLGLWYPSLRPV